ncbi:hypothetical protein [Mycolicibacterium chubuense]|uniref:Uncharacterized protein n=1 Tax=Mycolicibacterium chubuense TaxID=1800 RepID=A0A0J6WN06_MYCCU|nr:hypothetical protein [Mycolicibacterium chubuense]KMO83072.1 hypothetical protein MCHUDSM44219_01329 [Mycolicibacterium chubuense]SPY00717.1 Uncharacterised protein [Mycolicibacterium chubuense]
MSAAMQKASNVGSIHNAARRNPLHAMSYSLATAINLLGKAWARWDPNPAQ